MAVTSGAFAKPAGTSEKCCCYATTDLCAVQPPAAPQALQLPQAGGNMERSHQIQLRACCGCSACLGCTARSFLCSSISAWQNRTQQCSDLLLLHDHTSQTLRKMVWDSSSRAVCQQKVALTRWLLVPISQACLGGEA